MKVALVVMPFAASDRPSLAGGLLKALLSQRELCCECKYFNITFARLLGQERYERMAGLFSTGALAGEWIFSQIYFGASLSSWETYREEVLDHHLWGLPRENWSLVQDAKKLAPLFLRIVYESCNWSDFDLVGFTSTFEQTMPSMCLARMIRQGHPRVKIAVGGANFEGSMGRVYFDLFPEIDFISTGEADVSFPRLCENLAQGRESVPKGILCRQGPGEEGGAEGPGRVDGGRGGCRLRESLFPAAFAVSPVPQSLPWLRFPPPLIEPDLRISRIRLSDGLHERACAGLLGWRSWRMSSTPKPPYTSLNPKRPVL